MSTRCFVGNETPEGVEYIEIAHDGYYGDANKQGVGDKIENLVTRNEVSSFIKQGNRWTFEDVISTFEGCVTALDADVNERLQLGKSTSKCSCEEAFIQQAVNEGVPYAYIFKGEGWRKWTVNL